MAKNILYFVFPFFLFSCSNRKKYESNPVLAQRLYEEGQNLLSERIKIQDTDTAKAMNLNKKVLEKFEVAYNSDTSNQKILLFASECTMFSRDYRKCIYWTSKFIQHDTTNFDSGGFYERMGYCYDQLGETEKSKPYYEKALEIRKKSGAAQ